jgi:hypothetical protein
VVAGGFLQDHRDTTATLLDQARDQHTWVFNFDLAVKAGFALRGL